MMDKMMMWEFETDVLWEHLAIYICPACIAQSNLILQSRVCPVSERTSSRSAHVSGSLHQKATTVPLLSVKILNSLQLADDKMISSRLPVLNC